MKENCCEVGMSMNVLKVEFSRIASRKTGIKKRSNRTREIHGGIFFSLLRSIATTG